MRKLKKFLPYLKGSYGLMAFSLFCALLSTGAKLLIPFLAGKAINAMQAAIETRTWESLDLSFDFILMASLLVVGTLFRYLFDYVTYLLGQRVIKTMRKEIFAATLRAPISSIDQSRK